MKTQKILSFIICLAMLVSFVPAYFAEDAEEIVDVDFSVSEEGAPAQEETPGEELFPEEEEIPEVPEEDSAEENPAEEEIPDEEEEPAEDELPEIAETEDGEEPAEREEFPFPRSAVHINPVYESLFDAASIPLPEVPELPDIMLMNAFNEADYITPAEASMQIAANVIARVPSFDIFVAVPKADDFWLVIYNAELDAGNNTSGPKGGDSITYQYGRFSYTVVDYHSDSTYFYAQVNCEPLYYTTAAQEAQLDGAAAGIIAQLGLAGKSDYEKIEAIYDYVCSHVVYDYAHVGENGYYLHYSAYGALCSGTAVCQGIGLAVYRLCMEAGLGRVHLVTSNAMDHAWNIVDPGSGRYYYCDATWDLGTVNGEHRWFLRGRDYFSAQHSAGGTSYLGDCSPVTYVKTEAGKLRYTRSYAPAVYDIDAEDYELPLPPVKETGTPVISALENGDGCIKISWDAVEGAYKYRVFCRIGKEAWKQEDETADCGFVLENAVTGGTYSFMIRCVDEYGRYVSPYSAVKGIMALASPKAVTCEDTVNSALVRWETTAGASAYKLYCRLAGESSWTLYGTVKTNEMKVGGLSAGKTYEFAVTSFAAGCESELPAKGSFIKLSKTRQLPAPEINLIANYSSYIKLGWTAAADEDVFYRVYRRAGTEPWQLYCETQTPKINFERPAAGTVYTFTVRCVDSGGNAISPYSAAKGIMRLESPQITSVYENGKNLHVKWNSSAGASGYKVYYRSGGCWNLLATVKGTETEVRLPAEVRRCELCVLSYASGQTSAFPEKGTEYKR